MRSQTKVLPIIFLSVLLTTCGLTPKQVSFEDSEIQPLWKAIAEVNRDSLGFSPIDKNAEFRLEGKSILFDKPYDLMLHIHGKTSRTIAFRKVNEDKFVWIGEQEIFKGPGKYETADGELNEEIVLTFDAEQISGHPINQLSISYSGPDENLMMNRNLKLDDVSAMIDDWTDGQ